MNYTSRDVYEFISKQTNDPIVEWKTCTVSGQPFAIYQSDLDFYAKISTTFRTSPGEGGLEGVFVATIPTPTLCPEERQRRRSAFRNFFTLRRRTCAATGAAVISQYPEQYPVYTNQYWRSDSRDAIEFGQSIDRSQSFTQQWQQLSLIVPRAATHTLNCENSSYCNMAANSKNCYLVAGCIGNEDCMYGHILWKSQTCLDMLYSKRCEQCYYCVDCLDCVGCKYCQQCEQCSFCIGCVGLVGKSYCIFNQQYSKEEYITLEAQLDTTQIIQQRQQMEQSMVKPGCKLVNCEAVYGNNDTESDHITQGYDAIQSQTSKYVYTVSQCTDCVDVCYTGLGGEQIYDSLFPHGSQLYFTHNCQDNCYQVLYSENCYACTQCFGCIGLRNKQYCIFNKQYTKEEYEEQVAKIVQYMITTLTPHPSPEGEGSPEWGEFFHPSLSPFGYNETVAQEYYPVIVTNDDQMIDQKINSEDVKSSGKSSEISSANLQMQGYRRSTYSSDPKIPDTAQVLRPSEMSNDDWSKLVNSDDIIRQVIICEISGRPFMIQKAELEFYRKHNLPIPRKHPDIRHEERMKLRPGRTLYLRTCDCCGKEVLSVYQNIAESSERPDLKTSEISESSPKIYCETCYQKEVFG